MYSLLWESKVEFPFLKIDHISILYLHAIVSDVKSTSWISSEFSILSIFLSMVKYINIFIIHLINNIFMYDVRSV